MTNYDLAFKQENRKFTFDFIVALMKAKAFYLYSQRRCASQFDISVFHPIWPTQSSAGLRFMTPS